MYVKCLLLVGVENGSYYFCLSLTVLVLPAVPLYGAWQMLGEFCGSQELKLPSSGL